MVLMKVLPKVKQEALPKVKQEVAIIKVWI